LKLVVGHHIDYSIGFYKLGRLSLTPAVVEHPHLVSKLTEGWFFRVFPSYLLLLLPQYFGCDLHPLQQFTGILTDRVVMLRNVVREVVRYPSLSLSIRSFGVLPVLVCGVLR